MLKTFLLSGTCIALIGILITLLVEIIKTFFPSNTTHTSDEQTGVSKNNKNRKIRGFTFVALFVIVFIMLLSLGKYTVDDYRTDGGIDVSIIEYIFVNGWSGTDKPSGGDPDTKKGDNSGSQDGESSDPKNGDSSGNSDGSSSDPSDGDNSGSSDDDTTEDPTDDDFEDTNDDPEPPSDDYMDGSEDKEESPEIGIEDTYDSDRNVTNGLFGAAGGEYYKYDPNTGDYELVPEEQIDFPLYEVNLSFYNSDIDDFKNCNISVSVPEADTFFPLDMLSNNSFNNGDMFYFQDGLYRFQIEDLYGNIYYSDYVHIDSSGHMRIDVEQY